NARRDGLELLGMVWFIGIREWIQNRVGLCLAAFARNVIGASHPVPWPVCWLKGHSCRRRRLVQANKSALCLLEEVPSRIHGRSNHERWFYVHPPDGDGASKRQRVVA